MNLQDALSLAKEHAEKHTRSFADFFQRGPSAASPDNSYEHILTGAVIYLVLGVTLQNSFIALEPVKNISWLDRAVGQLVFWVTIGLVLHFVGRLLRRSCGNSAFLVAFRVMPIAFLCGAYAASIGYFARYTLQLFPVREAVPVTIPHLFHIACQLAIISLFMPRELRIQCSYQSGMSRAVTAIVVFVVAAVDFVATFGSAFVEPAES